MFPWALRYSTPSTGPKYPERRCKFQSGPATARLSAAHSLRSKGSLHIQNATPAELVYIDSAAGGLKLGSFAQPTCDSTRGGLLQYTAGGAGVKDKYQVCLKNSSDVYAWIDLVPTLP